MTEKEITSRSIETENENEKEQEKKGKGPRKEIVVEEGVRREEKSSIARHRAVLYTLLPICERGWFPRRPSFQESG